MNPSLKQLLIPIFGCLCLNINAQFFDCSKFESIGRHICNENWSKAINTIEFYEDIFEEDIFIKNRMINIKADCYFELGEFEMASKLSNDILNASYSSGIQFENPKDSCLYINLKDKDNEHCYHYFLKEHESTSKNRAVVRLSRIEYAKKNYEEAYNLLSLTDSIYPFKAPKNTHGVTYWNSKEKAIYKSNILIHLGDIDQALKIVIPFALNETYSFDTLALKQLKNLADVQNLNKIKNEILDSLRIKVVIIADYYDSEDYSFGEVQIFKNSHIKESGRVVYTVYKGMEINIIRHNDVEAYEDHLNLKRRKRKKWEPLSDEALIEQAKSMLLDSNLFKVVKE